MRARVAVAIAVPLDPAVLAWDRRPAFGIRRDGVPRRQGHELLAGVALLSRRHAFLRHGFRVHCTRVDISGFMAPASDSIGRGAANSCFWVYVTPCIPRIRRPDFVDGAGRWPRACDQ